MIDKIETERLIEFYKDHACDYLKMYELKTQINALTKSIRKIEPVNNEINVLTSIIDNLVNNCQVGNRWPKNHE